MRFFVFNLLLSLSLATNAGAVAQAPDDILLGHGQKWHYRTTVAVTHQTLKRKNQLRPKVSVLVELKKY